jgi:outer membrane protein assembly factor BamB
MLRTTALAALALILATASALAADWPQWRGPNRDGTSDETGVPLKWSATENVAWKTPIPGKGHSSPIVSGDRVFVTTAIPEEQKRMLLCLDAKDGKVLWQQVVVTAPLETINGLNSYASSTPATDGKLVFVDFLGRDAMQVASYDFDGKLVWARSPGKWAAQHGFCSSPVLYKDTIILNGDQDGDGYLVAMDKATGETKWKTDRPNKVRSWCPPGLFDVNGKKQLILSGSKCVAAYDPDTGKEIWIYDGPTVQMVASQVMAEGVVLVTGGYPEKHLVGIRPDGQGNVTKTHEAWHERKGVAYVPSPIAWGQWFFVVADDGQVNCLEAKTGKYVWTEKLGGHHSASPVSAEGRLYFLDDAGTTWVLKAGPTYELLAKNELGEACFASPAISKGHVFVRALHNLYCIGK